MKPSRFSSIASSLSVAALALGLGVCVSTWVLLWDSWWAGPAVDSWHFVNVLVAWEQGEDLWRRLAKSHGGHRPFFPRVVLLADYVGFGGRNVFALVCSAALQLAAGAALVWALCRDRGAAGGRAGLYASGLVLAFGFCAAQLENFSRAWNVHWFLVSAAVSWSLVMLAWARAAGTRRAVAAGTTVAIGLAVVASWSMANGFLAWLCLGVAAVWLRMWVSAAAIGAVGFLVLWGFLEGYNPGPAVGTGATLGDPLGQVAWVLRFLGAPLSGWQPAAGFWLGAAGIAALVVAGWIATRRVVGSLDLVALGIATFCVGSALMISWGRMAYSEASWSAPRYQTVSLLFWVSLLVWFVGRIRGGPAALGFRAVTIAAVALWLIPGQFAGAQRVQGQAQEIRAANLAVLVGVADRMAYQATLPFSDARRRRDAVVRHAPFLRRHGFGMFYGGRRKLMGLSLEALYPERSDACEGGIFRDTLTPSKYWARVEGWAREFDRARVPELLFTDSSGRVVGLGEPVRHFFPGIPDDERWFVGWRKGVPDGAAWAVLADGSVCRIATWGAGQGPIAPVSRSRDNWLESSPRVSCSTSSVCSPRPGNERTGPSAASENLMGLPWTCIGCSRSGTGTSINMS